MTRRVALWLAPAVGVVGALALWELAVIVFDVRPSLIPRPTKILGAINGDRGFYWRHARATIWEAAAGFAFAFVIAMVTAAVMAHLRFLERAISPLLILLQVTPIIAYAPAVVLWIGFGFRSIVTITAISCYVPFVVNATIGFRSVDPTLIELARSVDASRLEVFVRLRVPSALPGLFSAARIAVGLALIGAVLGEWFGVVDQGLGYAVKIAQSKVLLLQLWGAIYILALIGGLAIVAIGVAERLVLHWHASQREIG